MEGAVYPPNSLPPTAKSPRNNLLKISDPNLGATLESISENGHAKNAKSKFFSEDNASKKTSNPKLGENTTHGPSLAKAGRNASKVGLVHTSLTPPTSSLGKETTNAAVTANQRRISYESGTASPRGSAVKSDFSIEQAMALAVKNAAVRTNSVAASKPSGSASPRMSIQGGGGGGGGVSPRQSISSAAANMRAATNSSLGNSSPRNSAMGNSSPRSRAGTQAGAVSPSGAGLVRQHSKRASLGLGLGEAERAIFEAQQAEIRQSLANQQAEVKRLRDMARTAFKIDDIESLMMKAHMLAQKAHKNHAAKTGGEGDGGGEDSGPDEAARERLRIQAMLEAEEAEEQWQQQIASEGAQAQPDRDSHHGADA